MPIRPIPCESRHCCERSTVLGAKKGTPLLHHRTNQPVLEFALRVVLGKAHEEPEFVGIIWGTHILRHTSYLLGSIPSLGLYTHVVTI